MTEHWLRLGELDVRYLEAGAGPPVVFAAGLGISADFYRPNLAALAASGFRAIAPDLPGFGETDGARFGSSIMELSEHLRAFARALHISHAHWIGHSIGCQAALHLAAHAPGLARSLVLAGPTGGYGHRLTHQIGALAFHAARVPWRLLEAVLRDYVRLSPFTYVGTWIKASRDDPLDSAARVRCPALILIGTRDRMPGGEFITLLSQKLGNAEIVKLAGGQHGLPLDAQRQFDHAVISFLTSAIRYRH
ncbi:MAG: alpha/beta fold hydrolase [Gemmatimonadota bacterium]